jgi:hypothetical protein
MHKAVLSILFAASATAAQAAVVNIDFNSATGNLGTSHTYSGGGLSVTATGHAGLLGGPINLFGKNDGGDENGVGIASDPTGDHEIWGDPLDGSAIVLDVSDLLAHNVTEAQFFMGSTTNGEQWTVWESCGATCWVTYNFVGSDEGVWHDLPDWGSSSLYAFTAGNIFDNSRASNVLLGGLSLTQSVPEPATWAMMLLGFGAMGVAFRRRRRTSLQLPQIA